MKNSKPIVIVDKNLAKVANLTRHIERYNEKADKWKAIQELKEECTLTGGVHHDYSIPKYIKPEKKNKTLWDFIKSLMP